VAPLCRGSNAWAHPEAARDLRPGIRYSLNMTPGSKGYRSSDEHTKSQLAGLTEPGGSGEFERPVATSRWRRPSQVWAEAGFLRWKHALGGRGDQSREVRPDTGLLSGFLSLADASDEDIVRYATRWGTLGICEHGLPASHPGEMKDLRAFGEALGVPEHPTDCEPGWRHGWHQEMWDEPLSAWRQLASATRCLLRLAAALHQGRIGDEEDWVCFTGPGETPQSVDWGRLSLGFLASNWLQLGGVGFAVEWFKGPPVLVAMSGSLFAALALDVASALPGGGGFAFCSSCGTPFTPTRRPVATRRRYCPDCRSRHVPELDAQHDSRARRRAMSQTAPQSPSTERDNGAGQSTKS
jgi:hypothetical protein